MRSVGCQKQHATAKVGPVHNVPIFVPAVGPWWSQGSTLVCREEFKERSEGRRNWVQMDPDIHTDAYANSAL